MSRVALVTGAAGGIGSALVARLEADGWLVDGVDVDDADLATRDGNRAVVDAALERFGRLDHPAIGPNHFHLVLFQVLRIAANLRQNFIAQDRRGDVPVRSEDDFSQFLDEDGGAGAQRLSNDDVGGQRRSATRRHRVPCPQPEHWNVDEHQTLAPVVRQPAQPLEGELDLSDAPRQRRLQRPQRGRAWIFIEAWSAPADGPLEVRLVSRFRFAGSEPGSEQDEHEPDRGTRAELLVEQEHAEEQRDGGIHIGHDGRA